jgi:hypothetical protein
MNLDRDHDPDRLVEAWLDEGPRTFSPRLLDRTLGEIHGTRQQRQRPLPWSPSRMNLTFLSGLAGAAVLAVLFAASAFLPWLPSTFFGPAGSPTPSPAPSPVPTLAPTPTFAPTPTPDASTSPQASPVAPTFLAGDVPFEGTTWQLVGRIDDARGEGDPSYISPVGDRPAFIRFDADGTLRGDTGCRAIAGSWDATPRIRRTFPADIRLGNVSRAFACVDPLGAQDVGVQADLDGAGALQLTTEGYQTLASGLTDADLDPRLLAHFNEHPALVRLIVRDQSGEGSLIYAPVAPDVSALLGRTWGIAGDRTDAGLIGTGDVDAVTVRFDDDGTFTAADPCGTLGGAWGKAGVTDGPPIAGETAVDLERGWCRDDRSQGVLRVLPDLQLGDGVIRAAGPSARDDAWPDDVQQSFDDRGGGLLLHDADGRVAALLVPSERLPSPPPEASAPSMELLALTTRR